MRLLLRNKTGFSLVEVLVVVAMIGVIMGAVYSLFITNQRTSYTSDETVEVQQNIRIAMDVVTKDLRMAGLLISSSTATPISALTNNTGPKDVATDLLPGAENPGSDSVTISTVTASGLYARVASDATAVATLTTVPAAGAQQASDAERFEAGDLISIFRPMDSSRLNVNPYVVQSTTANSVTFTANVLEEVRLGDIIAKVNSLPGGAGLTTYPNTVQYAVVNNGVAGCPANQFCLARTANGDAPVLVAQNIADFQLRYELDDNSVVDAPPDLALIKAVIVTVWGETSATRGLSGNVPKIRQLSSVVKLRNRR